MDTPGETAGLLISATRGEREDTRASQLRVDTKAVHRGGTGKAEDRKRRRGGRMEKTLDDARWGGGGEEAEAPGPFTAQQLKWMA